MPVTALNSSTATRQGLLDRRTAVGYSILGFARCLPWRAEYSRCAVAVQRVTFASHRRTSIRSQSWLEDRGKNEKGNSIPTRIVFHDGFKPFRRRGSAADLTAQPARRHLRQLVEPHPVPGSSVGVGLLMPVGLMTSPCGLRSGRWRNERDIDGAFKLRKGSSIRRIILNPEMEHQLCGRRYGSGKPSG